MSRARLPERSTTNYPQECGPVLPASRRTALNLCQSVPPVPAATRGPVRIDLDWDALEIAVERNSPGHRQLPRPDHRPGHHDHDRRPRGDAQPPAGLREHPQLTCASSPRRRASSTAGWRSSSARSTDEPLRERLIISIDGKGAFRRFKDVLLAYPAERERWFSYRAELLHWHIQQWLEQHDIHRDQRAAVGRGRRRRPSCRRSAARSCTAPRRRARRCAARRAI